MNDINIGHVQKLNGFGKPENMKLYNQVKNKIIKSQPKQSGGVKPNLTIKNDIDAVKEEPMSDIIISKYLKNQRFSKIASNGPYFIRLNLGHFCVCRG